MSSPHRQSPNRRSDDRSYSMNWLTHVVLTHSMRIWQINLKFRMVESTARMDAVMSRLCQMQLELM